MTELFTTFQEFKQRYPIRPGDKGALLGSGSYGRVIKVEDQLETEWVAIKISEFKGNDTKSLKAEVELAKRVPRQANIARYDACYRLETDTSVSDFAVMKYYPDGNLADLIQREKLTSAQLYDLTKGILLGLQHLHLHHIVHRDFKPANILISRDNAGRLIPKIADFGLSKLVNDDEIESSDFDLSDGRGTPSYKAPEQIEGSRVSFNLDLWAFGVILYEMLTGEKPFRVDLRNTTEQSARREIEKKIMTVELPDRLNQIAEPYRSMIRRCLVRDIHKRVRKEDELLDLLDGIPQLMSEAQKRFDQQKYEEALKLFEQVQLIAKRAYNVQAQKSAEECRKLIRRQYISRLLEEADRFAAHQQFEEAKGKYEQILEREPSYEPAVRGLALCIDKLQPKPLSLEAELTDVYTGAGTDAYIAEPEFRHFDNVPQPLHASRLMTAESRVSVPVSESLPAFAPGISSPVDNPLRRTFSWRVVAPAVLVIGGVVGYFNWCSSGAASSNLPQDQQQAAMGPAVKGKETKPTVDLTAIVGETKEALTKRIDLALSKARRAYGQKNYSQVEVLTHSALLLDPTRKDVAALRNAALKEAQKVTPNDKQAEPTSTTPVTPKDEAVPTEPEKPKSSEKTDNPNPADAKQEAQVKYDQLIEEGVKAIGNGNNKAKAIDAFTKANVLAKEFGLNTNGGTTAYNEYMAKANRLLGNEAYEGAKGWYLVAQSLKDSEEVRRRIKQCTD